MKLSTAAIIEKNKTASNGADLLLCDITCRDESLHLVANNENIVFQGVTYYAYAFSVDKIKVSSTEMPSARLNISNITGSMQALLEKYDGADGVTVSLKAINTNVPDEILDEEVFDVIGSSADKKTVTLNIGTSFSLQKRFPATRVLKDFCPFKFKGRRCGYKGPVTTCNKTLSDCRKCGNNKRFGGCPTVPQGGLYVRDN